MNFVQLVTIDFISYGYMCAQTAVAVMLATIAIPVMHIIDTHYRNVGRALDAVQHNYNYDCNQIIANWCRLYVDKYGSQRKERRAYFITLFNLQDRLLVRTIQCQNSMRKIHP